MERLKFNSDLKIITECCFSHFSLGVITETTFEDISKFCEMDDDCFLYVLYYPSNDINCHIKLLSTSTGSFLGKFFYSFPY